MKIIRRLFLSLLTILLLGFGFLFLLQSRWTKDQLVQVLQSAAIQAGIKLSIGQIEGSLPLKWNFSEVAVTLPEGETIDIDTLQVRFSLLSLFWKEIGLSYLHANNVVVTYSPKTTTPSSSEISTPQGSFSLYLATVDALTLINRETLESATYHFAGSGKWIKGGQSFSAQVSLHSPDLDADILIDKTQLDVKLRAHSQKALAPFYTLPVDLPFDLKLHYNNLLHGNIKLHTSIFGVEGLIHLNPNFLPEKAHINLVIPDFSHLLPNLKGKSLGKIILDNNKCLLSFTVPSLTIDQTTFTKGELKIEAQNEAGEWNGPITFSADHPTLSYHASGKLYWTPHQSIGIKELDLQALIGRIAGDLSYHAKNLEGGISFQITDLSPLSDLSGKDLAGQMGGSAQFEGAEWHCVAIGKNLKIDQFLSDRVDLDLKFFDFWKIGALKIKSGPSYLQGAYFNTFSYDMSWNTSHWDYKIQALGDWKGPFDLKSQGKIDFSSDHFQLICQELEGHVFESSVELQQPFQLDISKKNFNLDQLILNLDSGSCLFSTSITPQEAFIKLKADQFPLDFLTLFSPNFSLKGQTSLDIDLQASELALTGHMNLLLQRADIYPTGAPHAIQTKGNFQAHFSENVLQTHGHLVATGEQLCNFSATLPFQFKLTPFEFEWIKNRPIAGQCTVEGSLEQLFDFVNIGSQRVGGFISSHVLLSGTLDDPILQGPISIQGGFYENYFIGIGVKDAAIDAVATGKEVVVTHANVTDGEKGTAETTAVFRLTKNLPFFVEGTVSHFRVIRFDWLTGAVSGPFTIEGNLEKALAKAKLELDEADVSIPDQLPSDLPALPVTFINQGKSHSEKLTYSEAYPFCYELDVHGDHDLRLSGRGLEAELEGTVHMTGKNLSVIAAGTLFTKKGKFSFAGKDFNITKGELIFSESSAFMNITSTVDLPNLTVTIHFRGSISDPQLIFESNPALPTSSIISHILFNKDVSELSTPQAIQLANTIVSLSGGSGPNLLESIRKSIGIDRLSFSASEEGQVSVQIGKYLTHGVTITLNQSTESSLIKVEVELKGGFLLEAETQEDSQGKFSFKWNKNY